MSTATYEFLPGNAPTEQQHDGGGWHSNWYADFQHKELAARHKLDDKSQVHRLIRFGKQTASKFANKVMPPMFGYVVVAYACTHES